MIKIVKKKRTIRRSFKKAKKSYRRAKTKSMRVLGVDVINDLVMPGAYGYIRPNIANAVINVVDKVPLMDKLGKYKDETGMIITGALVSKFVGRKVPIIRKLAQNMIRIESASLGSQIRAGGMQATTTSGGNNSFR